MKKNGHFGYEEMICFEQYKEDNKTNISKWFELFNLAFFKN